MRLFLIVLFFLSGCMAGPHARDQIEGHTAKRTISKVKVESCLCANAPIIGVDRLGDSIYVHHRYTSPSGASWIVDEIFHIVGRERPAAEPKTGRESRR